jgi:hypothetical protein
MTHGDTDRPTYEPPDFRVLGTVHELTLLNLDLNLCVLNKTLGSPDFWNRIPIANCSG